MNSQDFAKVVDEQIALCQRVLGSKAAEYATDDDRLHNFKIAAALPPEESPAQSLLGMMKKHTVSVYDMAASGEPYPLAMWEEKIGDHINYLLILKALVLEPESNLVLDLQKGNTEPA